MAKMNPRLTIPATGPANRILPLVVALLVSISPTGLRAQAEPVEGAFPLKQIRISDILPSPPPVWTGGEGGDSFLLARTSSDTLCAWVLDESGRASKSHPLISDSRGEISSADALWLGQNGLAFVALKTTNSSGSRTILFCVSFDAGGKPKGGAARLVSAVA